MQFLTASIEGKPYERARGVVHQAKKDANIIQKYGLKRRTSNQRTDSTPSVEPKHATLQESSGIDSEKSIYKADLPTNIS